MANEQEHSKSAQLGKGEKCLPSPLGKANGFHSHSVVQHLLKSYQIPNTVLDAMDTRVSHCIDLCPEALLEHSSGSQMENKCNDTKQCI